MLGRITDGSDYPESYWFSFTGSVRPWEILLPLEATTTTTKSYTSAKTKHATWASITDAPQNGQVNVWENNGCFTGDKRFLSPCWNKNNLKQPKLLCQSGLLMLEDLARLGLEQLKLLQMGLRLYYELMLPYSMFCQILSIILLKRPATIHVGPPWGQNSLYWFQFGLAGLMLITKEKKCLLLS